MPFSGKRPTESHGEKRKAQKSWKWSRRAASLFRSSGALNMARLSMAGTMFPRMNGATEAGGAVKGFGMTL